jgi:tetratricopeptide (TPR) repeat protein
MVRYFLALLVSCAAACGGSKAPPASAHDQNAASGEVEVPRTVVTPAGASSIPELLRDAAALATAERWGEAAAAYDRAYRLEPEGSSGDEALWGAADAHDHANAVEPALSRYELLAQREPDTARGRDALVRATRLLVFLDRFAAAGVYAERLLKKVDELNDFERIAVLSARALAFIERGEDQQASYFIEKGRDIIESRQLDAPGRVPRDLAQLYYALGESRRIKAERIVFQPTPPNFGAVLEQRCQGLLDAQSAYSDAMRAYDSHWSAMAGFRVAELYEKLHQDLQAVLPPPSAATDEQRALWTGAVHTRYAILLTKAKAMAEHTLAMADRVGEHSDWVSKTRKVLQTIDQQSAAEASALAKLPYTREDYERYIAEKEAEAAGKASAPGQPPAGKAALTPAPGSKPKGSAGTPEAKSPR